MNRLIRRHPRLKAAHFCTLAIPFLLISIACLAQSVGWMSDCTTAPIPARPAAGMVHGSKFVVDKVELGGGESKGSDGKKLDHSTYFLHLRSGKEFFADKEFVLFIAADAGEKLDGKAYTLKMGDNFKQPVIVHASHVNYPAIQGVHMSYKTAGKNLPETEMFMDKATLRLSFGKSSKAGLPGRIYLCVQDAAKSFVAGAFTAVPDRFQAR